MEKFIHDTRTLDVPVFNMFLANHTIRACFPSLNYTTSTAHDRRDIYFITHPVVVSRTRLPPQGRFRISSLPLTIYRRTPFHHHHRTLRTVTRRVVFMCTTRRRLGVAGRLRSAPAALKFILQQSERFDGGNGIYYLFFFPIRRRTPSSSP